MKKQLTILATSILTASANAAFEEGNAVLYAWDPADNDTYFVDLGLTGQDIVDGYGTGVASDGWVSSFYDAGLAAWLSTNAGAQWSIVATVNDTTPVGGPPAPFKSLLNSGIVSTSTDGVAVGTYGATNGQQQDTLNAWLAQVQAASGGSKSFSVFGTDPEAAGAARNGGGFGSSMIALDATSNLVYSQANPADGATLADYTVVTSVGGQGFFSTYLSETGLFYIWGPAPPSQVPIPATAWLFGSGLVGLLVAKRKS